MNIPQIIQGGMGIAVSDYKLANAVCKEGYLGVVSGTGVNLMLIGRLQHGDPTGNVRRALKEFPFQDAVQRILDKYFVEGGIPEGQPYKRPTMYTLNPPQELNQLIAIANFVEVRLAQEGHDNPVGINLMEKLQRPLLASAYGAILAGVDVVIMGAGIPMNVPGELDRLANNEVASYEIDVIGADADDDYRVVFDPEQVFPGVREKLGKLKRPYFFPIVASVVLAKAFTKKANGAINGFVVELPLAGGHNAPPRGKMKLNERGEPIYGRRDEVDLAQIKELGYPFWMAGGYGSPEMLVKALEAGASGVQVGTAFAYASESGMEADTRRRMIDKVIAGSAFVLTSAVGSPTGFPFKVAELEGTISEADVYESRPRICDIGVLRHNYKKEDGSLGYRCSAEPVDQYVKKGGKEADSACRICLCNNLAASAGVPMIRKNGYVERPVVTSGDELPSIIKILKPDETSYTAKDVIAYLTVGIREAAL